MIKLFPNIYLTSPRGELIYEPHMSLELVDEKIILEPKRTIIYLLLFALSILIVFRGIPYWIGLIVIPIVLIVMDYKALLMVDYGLLFSFVFFSGGLLLGGLFEILVLAGLLILSVRPFDVRRHVRIGPVPTIDPTACFAVPDP